MSVCRCSALRSGRFRFYGPCVARQGRLHGPPPRPHARRPPCAPPPGAVTENLMCGPLAGAAGGVRRTNTGQPGLHAARPNSQLLRRVQPVTTRVCSGYRAPAAAARGNKAFRTCGRRRAALPRPSAAAGKAPCEGVPSPAAPGAVEPLKPRVPTVPQSPTWPDSPPGT